MRNYIYKIIIFVIAIIIIFEFTIGRTLDQFNKKIDFINNPKARQEIVSSIKKEMQKANERENYLDEDERVIISNFIKKLRKELDLSN